MAGFAGLIVATLSTVIPTEFVALAAHRAETRLKRANWYAVTRRSLPPIVVGLIVASAAVTGRAAISSYLGVAIALGVALHITLTKSNPLVPLFGAIVVGVIAGRLGYL